MTPATITATTPAATRNPPPPPRQHRGPRVSRGPRAAAEAARARPGISGRCAADTASAAVVFYAIAFDLTAVTFNDRQNHGARPRRAAGDARIETRPEENDADHTQHHGDEPRAERLVHRIGLHRHGCRAV